MTANSRNALFRGADARPYGVIFPFWRITIKNETYKARLKARGEAAKAFGEPAFTGWLAAMLRSTATVAFFDRALKYFRRFRLIRTLFLIISYIVTFLGTGVALLIFTGLFLVVLPVTALTGFAVVFVSLFRRRKVLREMREKLGGKNVIVFFPQRDPEPFGSRFLYGQCLEAAKSADGAALVVTPYFLSSKGFGGKGQFITLREESERVYIVRRYMYFSLRRVLGSVTKRTVLCF